MAPLFALWLLALHALPATKAIAGVKITNLDVPPIFELGSKSSIVLDCDYTANNTESLVVKWFFNTNANQVYQWIPPNKPQGLGILSGRLDLEYEAAEDDTEAHRALHIMQPGVELSGDYLCVVSTFESEDSQTKPLLIYSTGKNLDLQVQRRDAEDAAQLVCSVEDVYPEPMLTIKNHLMVIPSAEKSVITNSEGLYDVITQVVVKHVTLLDEEPFVCELSLREANFTARMNETYIKKLPDATTVASEELNFEDENSTAIASAVRAAPSPQGVAPVILSTLMLAVIASLSY